ncbi:hypothetical protein BB560_002422 [Smittium megazygosporum]|uniref:INO80 complex subunit B-like conserved region domain-containing protein n=1 Tax=Smittium megazygosporum TaxID=133381 RepID=A0A2T9ZEW1_9FUNG|nr:hypothetical protein BB560_002422 [Smittium megazygosporum]
MSLSNKSSSAHPDERPPVVIKKITLIFKHLLDPISPIDSPKDKKEEPTNGRTKYPRRASAVKYSNNDVFDGSDLSEFSSENDSFIDYKKTSRKSSKDSGNGKKANGSNDNARTLKVKRVIPNSSSANEDSVPEIDHSRASYQENKATKNRKLSSTEISSKENSETRSFSDEFEQKQTTGVNTEEDSSNGSGKKQKVEKNSEEDQSNGNRKRPTKQKKQAKRPSNQKNKENYVSDLEDESEDQELSDISVDFDDDYNYDTTTKGSNMTKRQLAKLNNSNDEELLELQVKSKKQEFSKEEIALKRSEYIRKRRLQSKQRAEQQRKETINRLLSKQTSKGRNKLAEEESKSAGHDKTNEFPQSIKWVCSSASASDPEKNHLDTKSESRSPDTNVQDLLEPIVSENQERRVVYSLCLPYGVEIADIFPQSLKKHPETARNKQNCICGVEGCENKFKYKFATESKRAEHLPDLQTADFLYACCLEHYNVLRNKPVE